MIEGSTMVFRVRLFNELSPFSVDFNSEGPSASSLGKGRVLQVKSVTSHQEGVTRSGGRNVDP